MKLRLYSGSVQNDPGPFSLVLPKQQIHREDHSMPATRGKNNWHNLSPQDHHRYEVSGGGGIKTIYCMSVGQWLRIHQVIL